ncbi:hypothetical protein L4X63_04880 [Geomonas sp. Red32]|uniref:hypothetical protein n=1 Tax=Geomonas sp. Red32 TaxID=2912856 RepID=UPI00202CD67C|nr:hypothetical protein [Geomonas sp. Red32]MCM0080918.1 hypothetical protein [Geomonas sp. Red32]
MAEGSDGAGRRLPLPQQENTGSPTAGSLHFPTPLRPAPPHRSHQFLPTAGIPLLPFAAIQLNSHRGDPVSRCCHFPPS